MRAALRRRRSDTRPTQRVGVAAEPQRLGPAVVEHVADRAGAAREGRALGVGARAGRRSPLAPVSLPTTLPLCGLNQMSPRLSNTSVCGSRIVLSGMG